MLTVRFLLILVVALTSCAFAQDCDVSQCTLWNNTYLWDLNGIGDIWWDNSDHTSPGNGDHAFGLSVYTTPKQFIHAQCYYENSTIYDNTTGCYECKSTSALTSNGYFFEEWGTTTSGQPHCAGTDYGTHQQLSWTSDTSFAAVVMSMGLTSPPTETSCSGNATNNLHLWQEPYGTFSVNITPQNPNYPIVWVNAWQKTLICPQEEATQGTPLVLSWVPFKDAFTGVGEGITFDFYGNGNPVIISWTQPNAQVAWLVLPDSNGQVLSAKYQMFSNVTPQQANIGEKLGGRKGVAHDPYQANGFEALRAYDANGDGVIDANDAVWSRLRLWFDLNHNGQVDDGELRLLSDFHIAGFGIAFSGPDQYHKNGERDQYQNQKKWVGKVIMKPGYQNTAPEFYDVVLRF